MIQQTESTLLKFTIKFIISFIFTEMKAFVKSNYDKSLHEDIVGIIETFNRNLDERIDDILNILVDKKGKKKVNFVANDNTSKLYAKDDDTPPVKVYVTNIKKNQNPQPAKQVVETKKEKKTKKPTLYNCFIKIRVASHKQDPLFDSRYTCLTVALDEYRGEMGKYVKDNISKITKQNEDSSLEENCVLCINEFLDIQAKEENMIAVNGIFLNQCLRSFKHNNITYNPGSYIISDIKKEDLKVLMINEEEKTFINLDRNDSTVTSSEKSKDSIGIPVLNIEKILIKSSNLYSRETSPVDMNDPFLKTDDIPGPDDVSSVSDTMDYNN